MVQKIDGAPPSARVAVERVEPAGGDRSRPVSAPLPADSIRLTGEATGLTLIGQDLARNPGLDMAKVMSLREALAAGEYRIEPKEIADRLLRLERELFR